MYSTSAPSRVGRRVDGRPSSVATTITERGQALVEFAFVLPVLVLMLLALVDFGRMVAIHSATITASREAARYGAAVGDNGAGTLRYLDCAGIRDAARRVSGSLLTLDDSQIVIRHDDGPGTAAVTSCDPSPPSDGDIARYDRIIVEVTYQYQVIAPLVAQLVGPMTTTSVDRRTIVKYP